MKKNDKNLDFNKLKKLYKKNVNIMKYLRNKKKKDHNSEDDIRLSYELQAGTYLDDLSQKEFAIKNESFCREFSKLFDSLGCKSILQAGVGDAKALGTILSFMKDLPSSIFGFDISLSRLIFAQKYLKNKIRNYNLFLSSAMQIPLPDNSIEIVFTVEMIEANVGNELKIIKELLRVTGKYLILNEPIYDLQNKKTCEHIEKNAYSKNLGKILKKLDLNIIDNFLLKNPLNKNNKTSVIVIKKNEKFKQKKVEFLSIETKNKLQKINDYLYCEKEGLVFPSISGVYCLQRSNSILSLKFKEALKYFNET